jgi:hypothetical protein
MPYLIIAVNRFSEDSPDRYGHAFQFSGDGSKQKTGQEKGEIERTEAVRHILRIMERLGVRWKRTPKPLPGWRDNR